MVPIVVVEDDELFGEELAEFLTGHGYAVSWARTYDGLDALIDAVNPDVVILDQFVNGRDALNELHTIRHRYSGGLVIFTGNARAIDRIIALEESADDFILKSVSPRELLARLRAVVRRTAGSNRPGEPPAAAAAPPRRWVIDASRHLLRTPNGTLLQLTNAECAALVFLNSHSGQLVTRDELSLKVLGRPFSPFDRSVDNVLSRIRKLIGPYMNGDDVIRAVRGQGYVFAGLDAAPSATAETRVRTD
nr:response regulator transcription factor [uncultured Rhodopila sp.]